jgi:catechol 2,3-dioxygenase-like lactoylglutathione lyase family enzyme
MISHVHVGVRDFRNALEFYREVMAALGHPVKFIEEDRPWAAWRPIDAERPLFIVGRPFDGGPASPGNGQMIALIAPNRAAVDRCHAAALGAGGRCEGPPGLRPHYHADYYGAYFRDPDGNKLCVCCHEPGNERA